MVGIPQTIILRPRMHDEYLWDGAHIGRRIMPSHSSPDGLGPPSMAASQPAGSRSSQSTCLHLPFSKASASEFLYCFTMNCCTRHKGITVCSRMHIPHSALLPTCTKRCRAVSYAHLFGARAIPTAMTNRPRGHFKNASSRSKITQFQ